MRQATEGRKSMRLPGAGDYKPRYAKQARDRKQFFSLLRCGLTVFISAIVFHTLFGIAIVSGKSMEPTLREGDVILFWKLSSAYKTGEIVLIQAEGRTDYVKRVCAVSGDTVMLDDSGAFYVNGKLQDEPYIHESTYAKAGVEYPLTLLEQEYFVLGDCRSVSWDSRSYGAVYAQRIDGKIVFLFRGGM